jgi:hypothetical protein
MVTKNIVIFLAPLDPAIPQLCEFIYSCMYEFTYVFIFASLNWDSVTFNKQKQMQILTQNPVNSLDIIPY